MLTYADVFLTTKACGATSGSRSAVLPKRRLLRGRTLKILRGVREGELSIGSGRGGGISKGLEEEEEDDEPEVLAKAEEPTAVSIAERLVAIYMYILY